MDNMINENKSTVQDNGGFLWGLLGCCIPIVGLVLFLVWKDRYFMGSILRTGFCNNGIKHGGIRHLYSNNPYPVIKEGRLLWVNF